jgi:hypothetical protein
MPFFRYTFFLFCTSIILNLKGLGQNLEPEPTEKHELSEGFYFGGIASVGTSFFWGEANKLFASPFLAKGGICLAWNHLFFEASASFLNGRQKSNFRLKEQDFIKNDRYSMVGAQTNLGFWIPISNDFWVLPTLGLSYNYLMPGSKELSESKTIVQGPVGCPGIGVFLGKKLKSRKRDNETPHIEMLGLRYEVIWPGIQNISGHMHQLSFSITGLLSKR